MRFAALPVHGAQFKQGFVALGASGHVHGLDDSCVTFLYIPFIKRRSPSLNITKLECTL